MHERHERPPVRAQDGHQRGRCDHGRGALARTRSPLGIARRASSAAASARARARPPRRSARTRRRADRRSAPRGAVARASRERRARRGAGGRSRRLRPGQGAGRSRARQPHVVGAPAERAGPVPGRERRHLVEEEELGELAGLQLRPALPAAELQAAGDPATRAVPAADATGSSCMHPRLPYRSPRAGWATSSENGVTRFCSGMACCVSRRAAAARAAARAPAGGARARERGGTPAGSWRSRRSAARALARAPRRVPAPRARGSRCGRRRASL